jgi:hypothetical protein
MWRYDEHGQWTWISGNSTGNQNGNYGTKGVTSPNNIPSSRRGPTKWIDYDGNLWIFGGRYSSDS